MANITLDQIRKLENSADDAESQPKNPDLPHAFGRYQITVPTAQTYGFHDATPEKLKTPDYNTQVASKIVSTLNERYADNDAAYIAYNGGDGMAKRWQQHNKNDAVLAQETQKYVARGRQMFPPPPPEQVQTVMTPAEATTRLRAAGYSWDDINSYWQPQKDKLRSAGYSEADIGSYFGLQVAGKTYPDAPAIDDPVKYFGDKIGGAYEAAYGQLKKDAQDRMTEQDQEVLSARQGDWWGAVKHYYNQQIALGRIPYDAFNLAFAWAGGIFDAVAVTPVTAGMQKGLEAVTGKSLNEQQQTQLHSEVAQDFFALGVETGGPREGLVMRHAPTATELTDARAALAVQKTGKPAVEGTEHIVTNLASLALKSGEDATSIAERAQRDPVLREQVIGEHPPEPKSPSVTPTPDGDELVIGKMPEEEAFAPQTEEERQAALKKWEGQQFTGTTQEAMDLARTKTGTPQPKQWSLTRIMNKVYDELFDEEGPVKRLLSLARGGAKIPETDAVKSGLALANGARGVGRYQIETAQTDLAGNVIGPSLKQILSEIKPGEMQEFRDYGVMRRAHELHQRGIETGVDPLAAQKVAEDPELAKRFGETLQKVYDFQDNSLRDLVASGHLSQETLEAIFDKNKERVPFVPIEKGGGSGTGRANYNPVKKITGNEGQIHDWLEQVMKQTFIRRELAMRNQALVPYIDELHAAGLAIKDNTVRGITLTPEEIEDISGKSAEELMDDDFGATIFRHFKMPLKDDQIAIWRDGKSEVYTLADPEAAKVIRGLGRQGLPLYLKPAQAIAGLQRSGIVMNPFFSIKQTLFYDTHLQAIIQPGLRNTMADVVAGLVGSFTKPGLIDEFMRSGAWRPIFDQVNDRYIKTEMDKLYDKTDFLGGVRGVMATPYHVLKGFADYMFQAQRRGRFIREREAGSSMPVAARQAQLASFHTGEKGSAAKNFNLIQNFFSAYLNGIKRYTTAAIDRPVQTAGKSLAFITAPILMNYLAFHDQDWYQQSPDYLKDQGLLLPPLETGGHPFFLPMSPGPQTAIYGALARRVVAGLVEGKAFDFAGYLKSVGEQQIPFQAQINMMLPIIENMANFSFFRGRPHINPDVQRNVALPGQYTPYTSETAKMLSRSMDSTPLLKDFNLAPWQIDNLINGWGGNIGEGAVALADHALRASGAVKTMSQSGQLKPNEAPETDFMDNPFMRSFSIRYPSSVATDIVAFGDRFNKLQQTHGELETAFRNNDFSRFQELAQRDPLGSMRGLSKGQKVPNLEPYLQVLKEDRRTGLVGTLVELRKDEKAMSNFRADESKIRNNPDINAHDKRQLLDMLYGQMVVVARRGNQTLDALGVK